MAMDAWYRHWGLTRHPFEDVNSPYVSLPSHDEAIYRLAFSIEQGHRHVGFFAEAGLGKTVVLRRALDETRNPARRVVQVRPMSDGPAFLSRLAESLGHRVDREGGQDSTWRALGRAFRVLALQGFQVILVVDDGNDSADASQTPGLNLLAQAGFGEEGHITIIRCGRPQSAAASDRDDDWRLMVRLQRLTRSQSGDYLIAKLAAAGANEPVFTPRAVTRLHGLSGGIPRGLEQLATLSLIAGAVRGLEVISPDVVNGVAGECSSAATVVGT